MTYTLEEAMQELTRRFAERPDETTGDSPTFGQPVYFRELAESAGIDVHGDRDAETRRWTETELDLLEQAERDNNAGIQREADESYDMTARTPDDQRIHVNDTLGRVARAFLDAHGNQDPYESLREANRPHAFEAMEELGIKWWDELIHGEPTKPGSQWTLPDGAERLYRHLLGKVEADYQAGGR